MRSEFEFINDIKIKYGLEKVGDDCAVLPKSNTEDLLITADMLVEDVDFRLEWTTPELLGHKSLAVSLSDIAAMGGNPEWGLLAVAIPEKLWKTDFLDRLYDGWHALAVEFAVEMIGGDVSRSSEGLVLDSTVMGSVDRGKAIRRSGTRPGDGIFVSGTLGGAAGGLKFLEQGSIKDQKLISKQLKIHPEVKLGKHLNNLGLASAMIDISDGLASDLRHLCEASGMGSIICAEKIPIDADLLRSFPRDECFEMAVSGGEDFKLLFTGDREAILAVGIENITCIGEITRHAGKVEIEDNGKTRSLVATGYRHF